MSRNRKECLADLGAGLAASLWQDRDTGRLLILARKEDLPTFGARATEGAFGQGVELIAEIRDPAIVAAIQRLNAEAGATR